MDKAVLFESIKKVMKEAFDNINNSNDIKKIYNDNNYDFNEDIEDLENILYEEINTCYKKIEEKEKMNFNNDDNIVKLLDSDSGKYEVFVLIPIFNASAEMAERCIYSIMDNFRGTNYKIITITNKELDIFKNKDFLGIPHVVFKKNRFSLPEAYNYMIDYARSNKKDENTIISLMDDDAYILSGQNSKIKDGIEKIKKDEYIAVSGHYYDITPVKTKFQAIINETHTQEFSTLYRKPYCHGGACFMMKLNKFPFNGLPIDGLGGISINILEINEASNPRDKWYLYNDPSFLVFHPRKSNLFSWIATYLSYEIAWNRALDMLDEEKYIIWREKIKETSQEKVKGLYKKLLNKDERLYVLGNLYLTRYFKPLLRDNLNYIEFKNYKISTHINLK